MSGKTVDLKLKENAPDEVEHGIGTVFNRTFRRGGEPFRVEKRFAASLLETGHFEETAETEPTAATAPAPATKPAKKS